MVSNRASRWLSYGESAAFPSPHFAVSGCHIRPQQALLIATSRSLTHSDPTNGIVPPFTGIVLSYRGIQPNEETTNLAPLPNHLRALITRGAT